jgi:hypothetical protein
MTRRDQVAISGDDSALHPPMDDPGVLPRREVWLRLEAAREEISTASGVEHGQTVADGGAALLRYGLCLIRRRRRTIL